MFPDATETVAFCALQRLGALTSMPLTAFGRNAKINNVIPKIIEDIFTINNEVFIEVKPGLIPIYPPLQLFLCL